MASHLFIIFLVCYIAHLLSSILGLHFIARNFPFCLDTMWMLALNFCISILEFYINHARPLSVLGMIWRAWSLKFLKNGIYDCVVKLESPSLYILHFFSIYEWTFLVLLFRDKITCLVFVIKFSNFFVKISNYHEFHNKYKSYSNNLKFSKEEYIILFKRKRYHSECQNQVLHENSSKY